MKLSPIVLRLRLANIEPFGPDNIAGAAEFGIIQEDTLNVPTAYVIQTLDTAVPNETEGAVSQKIIESFGVVVVLRNDESQSDKTGLIAYDSLFEIRRQLWNSLIGWELPDDEDDGYYPVGPIYYKGGSIIDINSAWLWYQFEFEYDGRLESTIDDGDLNEFKKIYAQWVFTPDAQIPIKGADPLPDAITDSDLDQIIDLTENLLAGSFDRGFASGFDLYKG